MCIISAEVVCGIMVLKPWTSFDPRIITDPRIIDPMIIIDPRIMLLNKMHKIIVPFENLTQIVSFVSSS